MLQVMWILLSLIYIPDENLFAEPNGLESWKAFPAPPSNSWTKPPPPSLHGAVWAPGAVHFIKEFKRLLKWLEVVQSGSTATGSLSKNHGVHFTHSLMTKTTLGGRSSFNIKGYNFNTLKHNYVHYSLVMTLNSIQFNILFQTQM